MEIIKTRIKESIEVKNSIIEDSNLLNRISEVSREMIECFKNGNKVIFCGNGGSAADAQHLAAEFSGRYLFDRPALPSEALHVNTSYLTAVGNDYSFENVYSRYISGVAHKGDVLVCLSTSGNSKNIVNAALKGKEMGMKIVSMTGKDGGKLKDISDYLLNVPSDQTPRIQESHITIGHCLCEIVEQEIFGSK